MFNKGLKTKLTVSMVITILIILAAFFAILNSYLTDYSRRESEEKIRFMGQKTTELLKRPLFNSDYNQIKSIAMFIAPENYDYVVVFDNSSRNTAFNYDPQNAALHLPWASMLKTNDKGKIPSVTVEKKEHDGQTYIQYVFPITLDGVSKPLGGLVIGISTANVRKQTRAITYRLLLVSLLLFLCLAITIYFLAAKLLAPIKLLSNKIGRFAHGDYSVRYPQTGTDEIGRLAESFNIMADKINEQILSIEKYNKNLAKMVEERTEELLKALDAIKEKDKKLHQAEKISSLNSIVSSIAHEINNPLAIISGNLQILEAKAKDDNSKRKLKNAQDAIQRIATLIDEINFFAAIKKDIHFKPLNFNSVLSNAVSKCIPDTVSLTIEPTDNDQITSNQNLLTLTLENILINAIQHIKFKEIDGKIHIKYYRDTYYLVVEISDNAGGFQDPTKVFDPFYTTFNEKKGLGLTFVYHTIQALNGDISVENTDKGAKVTLRIPESEVFEEKE